MPRKPGSSWRAERPRSDVTARRESPIQTVIEPDYGNGDSYRPKHNGHTHAKSQERHPHPYDRNRISKPNNHSKSSRKKNPSTRIKSLQKQLDRASTSTMPANILAEKERELAFLLSDRQQSQLGPVELRSKADYNKIVGRYHKIRFFERRKAERNLRRLRKAKERSEDGNVLEGEILPTTDELRRAEVDLVYTLYAPLDQKYVAVFPKDLSEAWRGKSGKAKPRRSEAQKTEADGTIVTINDPSGRFRPAHWQTIAEIVHPGNFRYGEAIVEEADGEDSVMTQDTTTIPQGNDSYSSVELTDAQLSDLEALRYGRFSSANGATASGPNADNVLTHRAKQRRAAASDDHDGGGRSSSKPRKKPAWQSETDEAIDRMDADTSEDEDEGGMGIQEPTKPVGRSRKRPQSAHRPVRDDDGDGDESDGDGGFFER
ncbi:rRNA-processing protein EFG1 [Cyphellophora attinorum]|uniref:rRNA-processing protein EFG1 n=1 Tax=Cyphellophora attinorum TaxID=1664694 RepID=A0A0N1HEE0_9EURO|nr:rRNA-processing protein EFG1 [Phialophora attinorum]KPI43763.1 rRNA-processing protein EFG1 [Phialophora attinorum]